ncbi:peptide/nickel transport system permease protein [Lutimaribacter pacificus]|uniref:Peptide/nickel transport system permease protein n=1 Tax=Lutimaribacter pacificus TaxID=391948 RepID=A0A1H0N775_9RHOB|nr:dipeptide/oligopeptide/nickel ABC transporter permease/ATP-binding protein [Lutimaribacter pacificus]SDO88471.1 peptide/nickel transport system permease protein [Lutimaribacter pacificus]SHK86340.1 peptide/nickel transport system permease protein [Lutimaribacter pacificus]
MTPRKTRLWLQPSYLAVMVPSVLVLATLVVCAIFADWISPYDPLKQDLISALQPPSARHWLGTDDLGRDVLSRLIHGCRIALIAAAEATGIAVLIGVPIGMFVGFRGGWWDWITMRIVEAMVSIPGIMVAIVIIAILGTGLHRAMFALGILYSTAFLRLARSVVLAEREEVYVKSARVIGASPSRVLLRHIFPNIAPPLIVQITLTVGAVLLAEAGLSFIGIGVQPPNASWGTMLNTAAVFMDLAPFLALPPGLAIVATVLSVNLLGDVIRDSIGRGIRTATPPRGRVQRAATVASDPVMPREDDVLRVEGLEVFVTAKTGEEVQVLSDLSFSIARGETLGLVGESGSGKTITGLAIMDLIGAGGRVTGGKVMLDGIDLRGLSRRRMIEVRGNDVAMVFQDPTTSLNPAYTVGNQIAEVLRRKKGLGTTEAQKQTVELIDRVGIPGAAERAKAYPHELSGGMAQRIAIARALSCNPKLLIADEPTTALDVTVQQEILDLFRDLQEEFGMAMLFVTHDLAVAADICDRISVMYAGEIVETAPVNALFATPRHPYTAGLLSASPHGSDGTPPLPTIPGSVPTPGQWPEGCRFSARCPYATAACKVRVPLIQGVRCVRSDEIRPGRAA